MTRTTMADMAGEKLLFEISTPGARSVDLPASDVPHVELDPALASFTERGAQGALALLYHLRVILQEIAGLDEVSLQPCAGAHGEWTALKVIRAYFNDHGQPKRRVVLAPDTAHGTNPASCAMCGAGVITIKSPPDGLTDLEDLKKHLNDEVCAVMVTNPNTVGKFDSHIAEMAELVHNAGAFLYLDGANM